MNSTYLVTGGAGFIGSHLCDLLIGKGYRVICMDNLITGRIANISHLVNNPNFSFFQHDVTKYIDISGTVNCVLHLASPASPVDYLNYPIQTLKVGSLGTHNALGIAKAKGAKFVLASTSEVYGDPNVHPQPESYWGNVNPVGLRGCYDESKRFAEAITMAYHKTHKIDTKIVRIFNTFGERMRKADGRVIPNFINQALRNEDLTVYGDGSQTRSFCYVSDLIDGIYKLILSPVNEPVNLGNPNEMKVRDLADEIIRLTGSKSRLTFKSLPADDPKIRCPVIDRAEKLLDWRPKIGLEQGLAKTIEWFKKELRKA